MHSTETSCPVPPFLIQEQLLQFNASNLYDPLNSCIGPLEQFYSCVAVHQLFIHRQIIAINAVFLRTYGLAILKFTDLGSNQ